jgi:hemerythrin superfamily protein
MKTATAGVSKRAGAQGKSDVVSLLKADHRKVEQLFAQFEESEDENEKQKLARQVCMELIIHTKLEEEIFYPACREKQVESNLLDEAQVEHDGSKVLIADILRASAGSGYYNAKVKTLSEYIKHHVGEEEQARSGIFAKAQKAGVDMAGLGQKLQARKQELTAQGEAVTADPPQPRSFKLNSQETSSMARYSNDRDRDERGRFTDDDGNRGSRNQGSGGNGERERDERGRFASDESDGGRGSSRGGNGGRGQSGGNGERERDERGRFASDDDYGGRGSSRGGRSQGENQGGEGRGWYGDSQGHSRASRGEGWEERGSNRSGGRYDEESGGRGSSRAGGGRGQGEGEGRGWYGDSQGHSQASREGWEDRGSSRSSRGRDYDEDDRGSSRGGRGGSQGGRSEGGNQGGEGRGWFGDSEGHSQAAREGWEDRGSSGSSRGRDDDEDDRGSSRSGRGGRGGESRGGEGHGGWFGDPRGHSEAAREGWRNR